MKGCIDRKADLFKNYRLPDVSGELTKGNLQKVNKATTVYPKSEEENPPSRKRGKRWKILGTLTYQEHKEGAERTLQRRS